MTQPEARRALLVCSTCKARKKGCDKILPICGYCSKRSLSCLYTPFSERPVLTAVANDSSQRACDPQALAWNWNNPLSFESFNAHRAASSPFTVLSYDLSYPSENMAFGDVLCAYVSYVLGCLNLQVAGLCHCFFDGFHQWLPTISPKRFIDRTMQLPSAIIDAQDSILLLAMCLIVLRPSLDSPAKSLDGLKDLYLTVKSYFARTQAVSTITLPLIQAGVLIAAYEYASRRAEVAYISIEICATMANMLDLCRIQIRGDENQPDPKITMRNLEERNVWWSIIIMERLIVAEMTGKSQLPMIKFPADNSYLPTDLSYSQGHDAEAASEPQSSAPLGLFHSGNVSGFGRQAQAASILDQSLRIVGSTEASLVRLQAAERLDEKLQAFLTLIMREYFVPGRQCGANAIIIRTLFLLHQNVIEQLCDGTSGTSMTQKETNSWAALDSAAKMMSDIAGHHGEHVANIDILPICASYNAQIAAKHIETHQDHTDQSVRVALESLKSFDKAFRQRWSGYGSFTKQ